MILCESETGHMSLATVPESCEESMKALPQARRHADDLLVYDKTPSGRGHRLVARFIAGELVKVTRDPFARPGGAELQKATCMSQDA